MPFRRLQGIRNFPAPTDRGNPPRPPLLSFGPTSKYYPGSTPTDRLHMPFVFPRRPSDPFPPKTGDLRCSRNICSSRSRRAPAPNQCAASNLTDDRQASSRGLPRKAGHESCPAVWPSGPPKGPFVPNFRARRTPVPTPAPERVEVGVPSPVSACSGDAATGRTGRGATTHHHEHLRGAPLEEHSARLRTSPRGTPVPSARMSARTPELSATLPSAPKSLERRYLELWRYATAGCVGTGTFRRGCWT
jgi:hypothetical protein